MGFTLYESNVLDNEYDYYETVAQPDKREQCLTLVDICDCGDVKCSLSM